MGHCSIRVDDLEFLSVKYSLWASGGRVAGIRGDTGLMEEEVGGRTGGQEVGVVRGMGVGE